MQQKWNTKDVASRFEEAISTLKKLPPVKVQGYINKWPPIKYTPNEMIFQEKRPMRMHATPDAISRMEETCNWIFLVNEEERKLIWQRAAKVRWKEICWEMGCERSTAWRKWIIGLGKIASTLNKRSL